jgi:hypothetical protein
LETTGTPAASRATLVSDRQSCVADDEKVVSSAVSKMARNENPVKLLDFMTIRFGFLAV